jgi:hypothetical protein
VRVGDGEDARKIKLLHVFTEPAVMAAAEREHVGLDEHDERA